MLNCLYMTALTVGHSRLELHFAVISYVWKPAASMVVAVKRVMISQKGRVFSFFSPQRGSILFWLKRVMISWAACFRP